jgi:hypothetical protein
LWFAEFNVDRIGRLGLPTYTFSVSAASPADGIVTGGGTFVALSPQAVTATANPGHGFVNWTQGYGSLTILN